MTRSISREQVHFWSNLLGNQAVWLCAVWGAGRGWQWPALVAASGYVVSQLWASSQVARDLRLVLLALLFSLGVDGMAAATGFVHYSAAPWGWLPPPWILALWASFAMMLPLSMRFLQRHRALPVVFGLLLAPLAYLSAQRGFAAVSLEHPMWRGLLVLGGAWALALSLLCAVAGRAGDEC